MIRPRGTAQPGWMPRPHPHPTPIDDERFVGALLPVVAAWCERLAAPGVDTDAAAHDVLLVVLRRRGELDPAISPLPWVYAVTRQVLRAHGRTAWLRRWLPGPVRERPADDDPLLDLAGRERARLVREVLSALGPQHREVLVLCDVEERSRAEVATLLGVPEGTVKSRLRLARAAFRAESERRGVTLVQLVDEGGRDG